MSESWYGVRCHFRVGEDRGEHASLYEERVTLWRAESFEAATTLAEAEGQEYAEAIDAVRLDLTEAYLIGEEPGPGVEVYSLIRESDVGPEPYLRRHFDTGTERRHDIRLDSYQDR